MADWLVPVSDRTRFLDKNGRAVTARFDAIRTGVLDGRVQTVTTEVRGALADLRDGDEVWIYWPGGDVGVIAVGHARSYPTRKPTPPSIAVDLHRARSRALIVDPMPAALVHRWLPDLRGASRLDPSPRALEAIRAWEDERPQRDEAALAPLGLPTWRARAAHGTKHRPVDDRLVTPIVPFLRSQNFAVGVDQRGDTTRLVARRARDVMVVHGVGLGTDGRDAALFAFGVAREHRWTLERSHPDLGWRFWVWLVFDRRPSAGIVGFLEDERVLLSWAASRGLEMSERSKLRWFQEVRVG